MCFVWIWEQTAIISLYSINWQIFIIETECAYCAVRTECTTMMHLIFIINVVPWLRRLVAGLSLRRSGFCSWPIHMGFVVNKVALGQAFLRMSRFSPVSIIAPMLRTHLRLDAALTKRTNGQSSFGNRAALGTQILALSSVQGSQDCTDVL